MQFKMPYNSNIMFKCHCSTKKFATNHHDRYLFSNIKQVVQNANMPQLYLNPTETQSNQEERGVLHGIAHGKVRKLLEKEHVGYVLVTCKKGKGSSAQKLEVEFSYDGDPCLASFMMAGAQEALEPQIEE